MRAVRLHRPDLLSASSGALRMEVRTHGYTASSGENTCSRDIVTYVANAASPHAPEEAPLSLIASQGQAQPEEAAGDNERRATK